jgi:hypothetical protein
MDLVELAEWIESATFPLGYGRLAIHISILDVCGSILVCRQYKSAVITKSRRDSKSSFESLIACTLLQFGGTTLTGFLLGQTPSWIMSHTAFPALLLAWYLTFFCPFQLFSLVLDNVPFLLFTVGIGAAISSG